jgi:hypothetical protein
MEVSAMIRRPNHRPSAAAVAAQLVAGSLVVLLGCAGGSGSSGFDLAENGAIMQAIDEERCVESDGLTICPANGATAPTPRASVTATPPTAPTSTATLAASPPSPTATPTSPGIDDFTPTATPPSNNPDGSPTAALDTTPTPTESGPIIGDATPTRTAPPATQTPAPAASRTPTPTPTATMSAPVEMRIDTSFGDATAVDCAFDGNSCGFAFAFAPQGFPPGTTFQVAARVRDPDGEWRLFLARQANADPSLPVFEAFLSLPVGGRPGEPFRAQVAVLVFLVPTDFVSPAVDALAQSSADFAFVTRDLEVVPGS